MKAVVASSRLGNASCHSSHDNNKPSQNQSPGQESDSEERMEEKVDATNLIEPQDAASEDEEEP